MRTRRGLLVKSVPYTDDAQYVGGSLLGVVMNSGDGQSMYKVTLGPGARAVAAAQSPARAPAKPAKGDVVEARAQRPVQVPHRAESAAEAPIGDSLVGRVDLITNYGGFSVAAMSLPDGRDLSLKGAQVWGLQKRASYRVRGQSSASERWGDELFVKTYEVVLAPGDRGLIAHLEAFVDRIPRLGCEALIEHARSQGGEQGVAQLAHRALVSPWALDWSVISWERAPEVVALQKRMYVAQFLVGKGMEGEEHVLLPLAEWLIQDAQSQAVSDESLLSWVWSGLGGRLYRAIGAVQGLDFEWVDHCVRELALGGDSGRARQDALVAHAVRRLARVRGHVYVTAQELVASVMALDESMDANVVAGAIESAVSGGSVVLDADSGSFYAPELHDAECQIAKAVARLLEPSAPLTQLRSLDLTASIQEVAQGLQWGAQGGGLDAMQLHAVAGMTISDKRLHLLTAGPGCGKTAVMRVLVGMLADKRFVFCALSGFVAKELRSRIEGANVQAHTIASLLGQIDRQGGRLNADVLVVEEGTLPDLLAYARLLNAVGPDCHVLVLGDPDLSLDGYRFVGQLPSIGPGRVLADLAACAHVDRHRLMQSHRSRGGILDVVEQVRHGVLDVRDRSNVKFAGDIEAGPKAIAALAAEYEEAVGRYGPGCVAVLLGRKRGAPDRAGWNTTYVNARFREYFNAGGKKIPCTPLREGDRVVIQDTVDAQLVDGGSVRLANGETGVVTGYVHWASNTKAGARAVTIGLDDGRRVNVASRDLGCVGFGWALTVHYTQGAQYKKVMMVVTPGSADFVNANMLLTGVSRAQEELTIYGDRQVIAQVASTYAPRRNSHLVHRIDMEVRQRVNAPVLDDVVRERGAQGVGC